MARAAVGALLDGKSANGATPAQLGAFADLYSEMLRAHKQSGTGAARQVFVAYAEHSSAVAALRAADPEPQKRVWSVAELLSTDFPAPRWMVPGLLPEGLVVLAGRPKLGKSWLALSIAVAVGYGGEVLGRQVKRGRVLYLALEDNPSRVQDRLRKRRAPAEAFVDFCFEWPSLAHQGMADLMQALDEKGYNLVVIDTISRALGRADQLDQAEMNVTFGALQRLALDRGVCLLLVDHHRKRAGEAGDVIDDVMGATSKAGVADAALGIYRERGQATATLRVSGRDVDDQELALQWDSQLFCWQLAGTAAGIRAQSVQAGIIAALQEYGGKATLTKIANRLNKDKGNLYRELQELMARGEVRRGAERQGREVIYTLVANDSLMLQVSD
jgi:hypothetical protein